MKGELILIPGVIIDIITTVIGIRYYNLSEGNILGFHLVIFLNTLVILTALYTLRKERNLLINNSLIVLGLLRIIISLYNLSLY